MVYEAVNQVKKDMHIHKQDPVLAACIFSHLGEFSPVITIAYRVMVTVTMFYFEDGISLKRRTVEFKIRFKDSLPYIPEHHGFRAHHFLD